MHSRFRIVRVLEGIELNLLRRPGFLPKGTVVSVWDEKAVGGKMCKQAVPVTAGF